MLTTAVLVVSITLCVAILSPKALDEFSNYVASLDQLLAEYRRFALPLPPDNALLVRCLSFQSEAPNGKMIPHYTLGFMIPPESPEEMPRLLTGTTFRPASAGELITAVEPNDECEAGLEFPSSGNFEANWLMATAIQCEARGWHHFAQSLYEYSLREPWRGPGFKFYTRCTVADLAWATRLNELHETQDRAALAHSMRTILASDSRLNTADNQGLVMSLEASLRPRKGVPGSIEAVMDDLVEMYGFGSLEWHRRPAPYLKVIEMGFDAVPQLINHLDDIRLTRYSQQMGYQPFPETPWEIKTIAREILEGIGCNIGKGEIQEQKLRGRQWLREVSKLGEERFFLERSLPSGTWPDEYSLWILRARFPRRLPDIYRKLLEERPEMESWMVADQIAECDLPLNEKLELFHRAARHKLPRHRLAALSELRMLSPQTYSELLLEELSNLPATPSLPYGKGDEAGCVWLVEHTDDSRAWEALLTATRRADVGFRIEILHQVIDVDYFAKQEKRLEFLSAFLDDDGVRDTTKDPAQFQGYAADMEYPRLEVRNLAAKRMARILGLEEYPKPTWDEREWAEFRSKVCSTYGH